MRLYRYVMAIFQFETYTGLMSESQSPNSVEISASEAARLETKFFDAEKISSKPEIRTSYDLDLSTDSPDKRDPSRKIPAKKNYSELRVTGASGGAEGPEQPAEPELVPNEEALGGDLNLSATSASAKENDGESVVDLQMAVHTSEFRTTEWVPVIKGLLAKARTIVNPKVFSTAVKSVIATGLAVSALNGTPNMISGSIASAIEVACDSAVFLAGLAGKHIVYRLSRAFEAYVIGQSVFADGFYWLAKTLPTQHGSGNLLSDQSQCIRSRGGISCSFFARYALEYPYRLKSFFT